MAVYFVGGGVSTRNSSRIEPSILDENKFVRDYRLNHDAFHNLKSLLKEDLSRATRRSRSLSVDHQILISLKLLGSGSFQAVAKDFVGISQPTVSRCLDRFLNALLKHTTKFIYMPQPNTQAARRNTQKFYEKSGFPGVIGAIDGTHIAIIAPHQNENSYIGRKGYHSLNMQAICDANMCFLDVVSKWPGATHDSYILTNSGIYSRFENGEFGESLLLGDSGYSLYQWLMTPILHPQSPAEERYNRSHKATRVLIERSFGILKMRWRILDRSGGFLCYAPLKVAKIALCCCILHNICRRGNIPMPAQEQIDVVRVNARQGVDERPAESADRRSGRDKRAEIVNTFG